MVGFPHGHVFFRCAVGLAMAHLFRFKRVFPASLRWQSFINAAPA